MGNDEELLLARLLVDVVMVVSVELTGTEKVLLVLDEDPEVLAATEDEDTTEEEDSEV